MAQSKADTSHSMIVLRAITEAFDKVWHLGLKYKVLHLELPDVLEILQFPGRQEGKDKSGNIPGGWDHTLTYTVEFPKAALSLPPSSPLVPVTPLNQTEE